MLFFHKIKIAENKKEEKNISSTPKPSPAKIADDQKKNWFSPEGQLVVDVYETDSEFVVISAIAGVSAEDLDISVEKDMLIIKGSRQDYKKEEKKNYFYQECYWGQFSRKIILPEGVDASRTEAMIDKGILIIKMPKILTEDKKKIAVRE